MQYAIHAWFDKHLAGMDVDTGPAIEAFLNGEESLKVGEARDPETWAPRSSPATRGVSLPCVRALCSDARDGSLSCTPPDGDGSATMPSTSAVVAYSTATNGFESEPVAEDTVLLGVPELQLNASQATSQIAHLVVTLYR